MRQERIVSEFVFSCLLVLLLIFPPTLFAAEVEVLGVDIQPVASHAYRISVTLKHADSGWDHYADRWEVVTPDGQVLAQRILAHPHENEQPFTRSLGHVEIPAGTETVIIQAHDKVHGIGAKKMTVSVPLTP